MLSPEARRQVREFVASECGFLEPIRAEVVSIKKAVFREIGAISSSEPSDKEHMLISLSAINLDLSDSLRGCVMNGQLIAGLGLLRWQIVLYQRCFTFYHSPEHLASWLKGNRIREQDLRTFMSEFKPSTDSNGKDQDSNDARFDDQQKDFESLSEMFHLNYKTIPELYELATEPQVDELLRHKTKRYLFADIRNTACILLVCLRHLQSIETGNYEKYNSIVARYNKVHDRLQELREGFTETENGLGI